MINYRCIFLSSFPLLARWKVESSHSKFGDGECGDFLSCFQKRKQLLDKKKSSRIKYGYHHVMDLKSKPKLYGAKLLIAVL